MLRSTFITIAPSADPSVKSRAEFRRAVPNCEAGRLARQQRQHASARICVIIVIARLMIDLGAAPNQGEQLLLQLRHIEQLNLARGQQRLERFINLVLRPPD